MNHCRNLVTDTHVRSPVVIEMYEPTDDIPCMFDVSVRFSWIYPLRLDGTIDTFRQGIVRRFVVFGHADSDMVVVQQLDVIIACVLTATIRVMYECMRLYFPYTVKGHLKCL